MTPVSSRIHGNSPSPSRQVVVIGAGPAGLTAAYLLSKQNFDVTVLEADSVVGGISRTAQYKGFRFDIGGHRFFTKIQEVNDLWEELLGEEFLRVPRISRIHYNGRFFDYPLRATNALAGLGLVNAVRILLSYLHAQLRPSPVEDTFEQWVTNRFGKRLFEVFFKTYTEKVWGIPCHEIRAEWAAQRIQGLSLWRAILAATALTKRASSVRSLIHEFKYPRLGPGQMWEQCRDRVVEMGNSVLLEHRVTAVEHEDGRVVAVRARTADGVEHRFAAQHVISSAPLPALVRALDPPAPARAVEAASGLNYRDMLVVGLVLDRADLFPDNWIYIHSSGVKVGRIQNFGNWSEAMVPTPGQSALGLEYFCFKTEPFWSRPDAELVAMAARELETLGLAKGARVVDGTVLRMPKAYPVYDSTYRARVADVRSALDPIEGLQTVGRNGLHKYNNQDHSMLTAMMAVWNIQGESHDVWAVNTDFEYLEEQRLEREPASGSLGRIPTLSPTFASGKLRLRAEP
jgi:protoporphyrinogen oxidase